MTEEEARAKTIKLFGEDSFTEFDGAGGMNRYYVGALPKTPGSYQGFMGFSWEEVLGIAREVVSSGWQPRSEMSGGISQSLPVAPGDYRE